MRTKLEPIKPMETEGDRLISRKISRVLVTLILVDPRKILIMFLVKLGLIHKIVAIENGAISRRPEYAYGLWRALTEAKVLGFDSVSVVEFGVSRGGGLRALERHAAEIGKLLAIDVRVVGFDSGEGMPEPRDFRDAPYLWRRGIYKIDLPELEKKLSPSTNLIIGDVKYTLAEGSKLFDSHPVAFVSFDLDYYSSTVSALRIFTESGLPRIWCFFDDLGQVSNLAGEQLAIDEYNINFSGTKSISKVSLLSEVLPSWAIWASSMHIHHDFYHPKYANYIQEA